MKKKFWKNQSLLKKLLVPMIIVMLLQSLTLSGTILLGGTIDRLNENSFDILNEKVIGRRNYLQNAMLHWANLDRTSAIVNETIHTILLQQQKHMADLTAGADLSSDVLTELAPVINELCRNNMVTGAYLVLDNSGSSTKPGYYVRDLDPASTPPADNSDLLLIHAPMEVVKTLHITTNTNWTPQFEIPKDNAISGEFYHKPFEAAKVHPDISSADLSYWGDSFSLTENDMQIITYSRPLFDAHGVPYGVLGIDVSTDYLYKLLPFAELDPDKQGGYLLAIERDPNAPMTNVFANGIPSKRLFANQKEVAFKSSREFPKAYELVQNKKTDIVYGCIQSLKLYNSNTPFVQDVWTLAGIIEEKNLMSFTDHITSTILLVTLISLGAGLACLYLIGLLLTRPITNLAQDVETSNPRMPVQLNRVHIAEIDQLSSAIEVLSRDVADSASKLSQIIDMTSAPIGAFEHYFHNDFVYCTNRFFEILGIGGISYEANMLSIHLFEEEMVRLTPFIDQASVTDNFALYELKDALSPRWVKIQTIVDHEKILGIIEDTTAEILEKKKIEYERDYDLLTNLFNRRAFSSSMQLQLQDPEDTKFGALVMLDLDNLKFINDNFGHDFGDDYIRLMAQVLKKSSDAQSIMARMSGDEFFIFFYGHSSKDEVRVHIQQLREEIRNTVFPVPENPEFRLRASAGVAWYPDDASDYTNLVKYADFAMYKVKNTTKGEFHEFELDSYHADSYLLRNNEELNKLIDNRLVSYHFQPIISAVDGHVFAYEALMRCTLSSIRSPAEVLALAKSQSKLNLIEQLTWTEALRSYAAFNPDDKVLLFVNSIANQSLPEECIASIEHDYAQLLPNIVLELTEQEELVLLHASNKRRVIDRWHAQIALDDFGTGYNGETALLSVNPHFVKIDMALVRDVDKDPDRQTIVKNLIAYSHSHRIKVIAEGVESYTEMEALIGMDVDLLQGYYLAMPKKELQDIPENKKEEIISLQKKNREA